MRVCVVGVGAVGGVLAAHLINSGIEVHVVARGATLDAIRKHGVLMTVRAVDGSITQIVAHPKRCMAPEEICLGVLLCVKAHSFVSTLPSLSSLLRPTTILLTLHNGLPFWWLRGHPQHNKHILQTIDTGGVIASSIPLSHCVGGVIYVAATTTSLPGEITPRLQLEALLIKSTFSVRCSTAIRDDYFNKLWGNAVMNPLSALTCATMGDVLDDPRAFALLYAAMQEVQTVGDRFGVTWHFTLDQRIGSIRAAASHKTSMLQDIESGKEPEIGPIVEVVCELGRLASVPTPLADTLLALISLRAHKAKR